MFEFTHPLYLSALALPFILWFTLKPITQSQQPALIVPFFKTIDDLNQRQALSPFKHQGFLCLYCIWSLLCIALAGPRIIDNPRTITQDGYDLMLVLDISPSMGITDLIIHGQQVSRLTAVKRAAKQFVTDRVGDKIGLILFGERPYLLTPLTYDHQTILERLNDVTVGLAGNSTSLGDALGLAVKRLQNIPKQGRVVVLLTDGVNNSGALPPMKAAEIAHNDGIHVYTIGLGAMTQAQSSFGDLFLSAQGGNDLDEDTLKNIAKKTDGHYFRATDMDSLQKIYARINQMEKITQEKALMRPEKAYYPWPLTLALILLLSCLINAKDGFQRVKSWGRVR